MGRGNCIGDKKKQRNQSTNKTVTYTNMHPMWTWVVAKWCHPEMQLSINWIKKWATVKHRDQPLRKVEQHNRTNVLLHNTEKEEDIVDTYNKDWLASGKFPQTMFILKQKLFPQFRSSQLRLSSSNPATISGPRTL